MDKTKKIDTRKNLKTVTSNTFITAGGLEKLSLKARKLLYIAISQCRRNDNNFYTYEISVKEFADLMNISTDDVYREADKITDELMTSVLRVIPEGKKHFKKYSLFSMCEYEHDGVLKIKLNPDMTTFLLELKGDFSQPLLNDFLKMRSPYSMAIWHLMQREMKSHKPGISNMIIFELSLEELREVTGTQEKLKQLSQFKERVFDKALREIEDNCGVKITYENIKIGRKVVGFRCFATSVFYVDLNEIPVDLRERVNKRALELRKLKRDK